MVKVCQGMPLASPAVVLHVPPSPSLLLAGRQVRPATWCFPLFCGPVEGGYRYAVEQRNVKRRGEERSGDERVAGGGNSKTSWWDKPLVVSKCHRRTLDSFGANTGPSPSTNTEHRQRHMRKRPHRFLKNFLEDPKSWSTWIGTFHTAIFPLKPS